MQKNRPELWREQFPWPQPQQHKYDRGSALIVGGPVSMTGAARLAALAAQRVCGVTTILSTDEAFSLYALAMTSVMVRSFANRVVFSDIVAEPRYHAVLIGPGHGVGEATRRRVFRVLETGKPVVLDADALTSFENRADALAEALQAPAILTPHSGEFTRLLHGQLSMTELRSLKQDTSDEVRSDLALRAAALMQAVIVLKGHHTVIASPDGQVVINDNAPPSLATAGSGDVLAGLCVGLISAKIEAFQAACMAVWLHGEAARLCGEGLVAEDLPGRIQEALSSLSAP